MRSAVTIVCSLVLLPSLLRADTHAFASTREVNDFLRAPRAEQEGFDLAGQILLVADGTPRRITLSQRPGNCTFNLLDLTARPIGYRSGDCVRLRGVLAAPPAAIAREGNDFPRLFCFTNVNVLGHGPVPAVQPVDAMHINNGNAEDAFVQVEGVVTAVTKDDMNEAWNWLVLTTVSGDVRAAVTEHDQPFARLFGLLDAEVRLKGVAKPFYAWRRFLGHHLILFGEGGLELLRPAPAPFSAPADDGDASSAHRQTVRGRVVGRSLGKFFLRTADGAFAPVTPVRGATFPALADDVEVSGFVRHGPIGIQMTEAVVRVCASGNAPEAQPAPSDPESVFSAVSGTRILDSRLYGRLVRLRGTVANSAAGIRLDRRIILHCGRRTFAVDVAHIQYSLPRDLTSACEIDVTGIFIPEYEADVTNLVFPKFKGFALLPRAGSDIVVTAGPPLWTVGRLAFIIAVLMLVIFAILIWNRSLRILSERRGKALFDERMLSAAAELKTEERTRLAVELHDSISQTLTGVAFQIDAAKSCGLSDRSPAARFLETARATLASCRQELRCCIWDLRTRTFDEKDMNEAVQKTLAPHLGTTRLLVRFNVPRERLSESSAHDTLRIIRELAANAIAHGSATLLRVSGELSSGTVRFSVRDNGSGFDTGSIPGPAEGHFGLQGIRERIGKRNGEMAIESLPGNGTKVTIAFPADEGSDDEP